MFLQKCLQGISCYDYQISIQGAIDDINYQLNYLSNLFSNYFFTSTTYAAQFNEIATSVASNPDAVNHVVNVRNNYASVVSFLDKMIATTRQIIVEYSEQTRCCELKTSDFCSNIC